MKKEIWKDIKGYNGDYQISNYGRVKSLKTNKEKILKLHINKYGYLKLTLYKNKNPKNFRVHRLVGLHFIDNPENKPEINHIDEDKTNNHVNNLEWVTREENINHGDKIYRTSITHSNSQHDKNYGQKRGISWDKQINKWKANIQIFGLKNCFYIGVFKNKEDAYRTFYKVYTEWYGKTPW